MNFTRVVLVICAWTVWGCSAQRMVPRGRPYATVSFVNGEVAAVRVKLREANLYQMKIWTRSPGPEVVRTKQRFDASAVKSIQFTDQLWQQVLWSDHLGPRFIFMREVSPGLRYTVFKELQCRCNNSFRTRRAFIFADGTVVRRQILRDRPVDPLPSGRDIPFSQIPTEVP